MDGPSTKRQRTVRFPIVTESPATACPLLTERSIGLSAAFAAVVGALHTLYWCLDLAFDYPHEFSLTCGTGMERLYDTLIYGVPLSLAVPFLAWFVAADSKVAVPVARCSAVSALLVWLTVVALIRG